MIIGGIIIGNIVGVFLLTAGITHIIRMHTRFITTYATANLNRIIDVTDINREQHVTVEISENIT